MPWKETDVLDQRTEFVLKSLSRGVVFTELCQEYGISPKTGYKWRERLIQGGLGGLRDKSRRPHNSPDSLTEEVVCAIVRLKNAHPHWGPYKIRQLYLRQYGDGPSDSSFKRVLDKAGLVEHKRKRRVNNSQERITTDLVVQQPNDVWTVDFKGWWKALGGGRCEPLTVRDLHSRYILAIDAMESTKTDAVQKQFEKIFYEHGLPKVILSDNGTPFATSHAVLGLSNLSVWWIALGIRLHRIAPSHPEQNGSHERMHRDIRKEIQGQIGGDIKEHQAAFDLWRHEYNWVRPNEAINMKVPGELYRKSDNIYSGTPDCLQYDPAFMVRRVTTTGTIKVNNVNYIISASLRGWDVGLKYVEDEVLEVWFDYLRLGEIDLSTSKFIPASRP